MRLPSSSSSSSSSLASRRILFPSLFTIIWMCMVRIREADGFQRAALLSTNNNGIRIRKGSSVVRVQHYPITKKLPWKNLATSLTIVQHGQQNDDDEEDYNTPSFPLLLSSSLSLIADNPSQSIAFSAIMTLCGAALGPFLDSFHSAFGVLHYDEPITAALWGTQSNPALITAWWVPILFGVAGWLIGWLYVLLDNAFGTIPSTSTATVQQQQQQQQSSSIVNPTPPKILVGISLFTFQYWLSGVLVATEVVDRTGILNLMSVYAAVAFLALDSTMAGFIVSAATALGGPAIEVGLLSLSKSGIMPGGYHYNDLGETGFFPLWIIPVYFLGGPAVGNLARGFWNVLTPKMSTETEPTVASSKPAIKPGCKVCNDTRCVGCPNCDAIGQYTVMGGSTIKCTSCASRGFVICRACFASYDEDPNDIASIREMMSRMPD